MSGAQPGRGLAPARSPRPIAPGERIHVIGAAGAGASAAALLARAAGADVTGCDPGAPSPYTTALEAAGIAVASEHDPAHVTALLGTGGEDGTEAAGIVSRIGVTKALTAVAPDHPELVAARAAGLAVEPWQQIVADAAASHAGRLVAIAGTHGKSTSSGWLVHVLVEAGRDPAAFVGALLPVDGPGPSSTARWGRGDVFVVEADEYAGNFDPYRPDLAVVLNAEWDHPDVFTDRSAVVAAFEAWIRAPGPATREVVVNVSDQGGRELVERLADLGDRVTTVGHGDVGLAGITWRSVDGSLRLHGLRAGQITARLSLPGDHNAANAACVAAAADQLGLDASAITRGLESFAGVGRRLEVVGEPGGVLVIDDYGHHPTAIRETIAALRERYPGRRLWAVHEPLTFHRTAAMLEPLAAALAEADEVVIADIWPGRDPDTTIASAAGLADAVAARTGRDVAAPGSPEATAEALVPRVRRGDVVLVMGGGRSYVIAGRLVERLSSADRG